MRPNSFSGDWRGSRQADVASIGLLGGGLLTIAIVTATQVAAPTWRHGVAIVALIALYVIACQTIFTQQIRLRALENTPTEPVLVAMLFLVPLGLVPLVQGISEILSTRPAGRRPRDIAYHVLLGFAHSWHCLGPVLVLWAWPVHSPDLGHWAVFLLAYVAQNVFDDATTLTRAWFMRQHYRALWAPMLWGTWVDLGLAAVGVCAIAATHQSLWGLVLIALNVGLMRTLARDRNELVESNDELDRAVASARSEARVDAMTDVGNRRAWLEALEAADAPPRVRHAVVLVCDLNGLKRVNDTQGHAAGDALIVALAAAAREITPDGGVVCRIGGDEFGLLVQHPADIDRTALARRLEAALAERARATGLPLSAEIGVAGCPPGGSVYDALQSADLAVGRRKVGRRSLRSAQDLSDELRDELGIEPPTGGA